MRRFPAALILALFAAACSSLGHVPADFDDLALETPSTQPLRLRLENGEITTLVAPLASGAIPAEARRRANIIFPGGTTVFEGREWGPLGTGYRIEKRYPEVLSELRSVLVDAGGNVLEQTHSLPVTEVPQEVLVAASAEFRRDLDRIDVVQSGETTEFFRIRSRDTMGRSYLIECALDGSDLRVSRILQAEVAVQR